MTQRKIDLLILAVAVLTAAVAVMLPSGDSVKRDSRLIVIGVKDLSWEDVISKEGRAKMPYLYSVLDGESAYADLISHGYASDAHILRSIMTGKNLFHLTDDSPEVWNPYKYVYLDSYDDDRIRELTQSVQDDVTCVIFSEEGNNGRRMSYRPYMPDVPNQPSVGFFLMWGNGVKKPDLPATVAPEDLAPTFLYLSGYSLPVGIDGRVLFGMLDDDYYFKKKVIFE